jgi:hypothetical protein
MILQIITSWEDFCKGTGLRKPLVFFLLGTGTYILIADVYPVTLLKLHMFDPTGKAGYFVENSVMCDSLFIC